MEGPVKFSQRGMPRVQEGSKVISNLWQTMIVLEKMAATQFISWKSNASLQITPPRLELPGVPTSVPFISSKKVSFMLPVSFISTAPFATSGYFWKSPSLTANLSRSCWVQCRRETGKFLGLWRQMRKETGNSVSGRMRRGLYQRHQGAEESYATVLLTYWIWFDSIIFHQIV